MSKNIFSDESFAEWLGQLPGDGTYDYQHTFGCLINQYLTARGCNVYAVDQRTWTDNGLRNQHPLPEGWDKVCIGKAPFGGGGWDLHNPHPSWTYGKALRRLKARIKRQKEKEAA